LQDKTWYKFSYLTPLIRIQMYYIVLYIINLHWRFNPVFIYFTLYIVVLTLKIDHCLVFISIKLSYLILITLSILAW
jgi:hypothetical protein